jgi:hypothetical protein
MRNLHSESRILRWMLMIVEPFSFEGLNCMAGTFPFVPEARAGDTGIV